MKQKKVHLLIHVNCLNEIQAGKVQSVCEVTGPSHDQASSCSIFSPSACQQPSKTKPSAKTLANELSAAESVKSSEP